MAGPISVTCPMCGEVFPAPAEIVKVDTERNVVLCRLDRSGMYGHLASCPGTPAAPEPAALPVPEVSKADLDGRVHLLLDQGAYVATGGSRACTMCGTNGDPCLKGLRVRRKPCCAACGEGNTHPAPGEGKGMCAEWAAARAEGGPR